MILGSVQKTTQILTTISEGKNKPVTLFEISTKTGINKSTCSHIISTLMNEGYVKRISHTQGYVIGPAVYCLSRYGKYDDDFVALCHPVMCWLHKKIGFTVILAVIQGGKKFIIDYIDTDYKVFDEEGNAEIIPDDLYRTATGRIMMANMNKEETREIYEKNGIPPQGHWDDVTSFETFCRKLENFDKKGIAKTLENRADRNFVVYGYAAAIYRYTNCVAAIGVAARCEKDKCDNFKTAENLIEKNLLKARAEINRRLRYS